MYLREKKKKMKPLQSTGQELSRTFQICFEEVINISHQTKNVNGNAWQFCIMVNWHFCNYSSSNARKSFIIYVRCTIFISSLYLKSHKHRKLVVKLFEFHYWL